MHSKGGSNYVKLIKTKMKMWQIAMIENCN
jgi:hypothetical protein